MSTPAKYRRTPDKYEQKKWLYQQYWGQLKTQREIADQCSVTRGTVGQYLRKHGIPQREVGNDGESNPFKGFYRHAATPGHDRSQGYYDEGKQGKNDRQSHLEKEAARIDGVSLDWHQEYEGSESDAIEDYQWTDYHQVQQGHSSENIDRVYRALVSHFQQAESDIVLLRSEQLDCPVTNDHIGRSLSQLMSCPYCPLLIDVHKQNPEDTTYKITTDQ